ncbi:MAG TPA: heavy metal-binding domain-containing protein [Ktedonobacterales bacterium]
MPKQPQGQSGQQDQQGQWVQPDQSSAPVTMPQHAIERLQRMRGGDGRKGLFTSDLSVNEFLLVKEAGFDPIGMVVGSSIYHIGYQQSYFNVSQELTVLSQAMYSARELAMARMEAEADALGADGIVGVRLDVGRYEWGADLAEFIAIGTAVRSRDGVSHRTKFGKPFTSDLSGQDFRTLLAAGYRPLGLTMGNCVYHVAYRGLGQWFKTMGRNAEMENFTQAIYDARELAMERMQAEAENLGADGITGTQIKESSHGWDSHVIEFFAVGTSVISIRDDHEITPPQMVLSLNS